jgi:hypothetical protein
VIGEREWKRESEHVNPIDQPPTKKGTDLGISLAK